MSQDRLFEIIRRLGDLPPLPHVASEVLRLSADPMCDMHAVESVVERDVALTAKVLRVSNSVYYGMKHYVGTLRLALVVLGLREIRNLVLGISAFELLGSRNIRLRDRLWGHSFLTAAFAKQLDIRLQAGLPGEAFVGGLLHDIGKLELTQREGDVYGTIVDDYGEVLCGEEREAFGYTHAEIGAALTLHWNFPVPLTEAIRYHHPAAGETLKSAQEPMLAAIVRIANLATHDDMVTREEASLACGDTDAWDALSAAPNPIKPDERFQTLREIMQELRLAVPLHS